MSFVRTAVAAAAIFLAGCQSSETNTAANVSEDQSEAKIAPILDTPEAKDDASHARPLEARVYHVALDLNVDFDTKRIGGTATLDIDRKPDAKEIVLDDKGLEIASITDGSNQPLAYKVGAADPKLGSPLTVALRPDTNRLIIKYRSAPDAGALQWLTPEQTAGKKKPYLFSQGQAIENRSWIPTQDSPGIRQSWEATIHVPAGLTAVMSAPKAAEPITQGGESVFSYKMDHSVAPYMIAIGVGDLAFKSLGPRTGVWTEPVMLETLRPLSMGTLRPSRPSARRSLRRDGKSDTHLPHADLHRWRQESRRPCRPRARAQLVGQPRHQCQLVGQLAERGRYLLLREPDHGDPLWPEAGFARSGAKLR